jgi:hypothetical protein
MRMSTKLSPFWVAFLGGLLVPSWTKNRIMREEKRIRPASEPSLAMSSARALSWTREAREKENHHQKRGKFSTRACESNCVPSAGAA